MVTSITIIIGVFFNALCIWSIKFLLAGKNKLAWRNYIKYLYGISIGIVASFLIHPISVQNTVLFGVMGGAFGEILLIFALSIIQAYKKETFISYYDDGSPPKFFITGDKHRRFDRVKEFCIKINTRRKDVLIVLGDAGFNYYNDRRDNELKKEISALNITLFCVHGNKENRPQNIGTYGIRSFCGGKVYYEPKYPNIYFAIDGEIYTFEGKKYLVAGGAHSVDKFKCLKEGKPFWYDEMPDQTTKETVEGNLRNENYKIHGMMTHTCPIEYIPEEMFMSARKSAAINKKSRKTTTGKDFKPDIDRSTEIWLGEIEKKLNYEVWFCGHYHVDKQIDKIQMMYNDIRPLHL